MKNEEKSEPSLISVGQMVLKVSPFQSQEFEQDWRRHFVGFQLHFRLNMTSQTQDNEK